MSEDSINVTVAVRLSLLEDNAEAYADGQAEVVMGNVFKRTGWKVPQIKRGHEYIFGLCAYKQHLTLAPWSERSIVAFRSRLSAYVVRKHCFLVPVDWRPDARLLGDLVAARLAELEAPSKPVVRRRPKLSRKV